MSKKQAEEGYPSFYTIIPQRPPSGIMLGIFNQTTLDKLMKRTITPKRRRRRLVTQRRKRRAKKVDREVIQLSDSRNEEDEQPIDLTIEKATDLQSNSRMTKSVLQQAHHKEIDCEKVELPEPDSIVSDNLLVVARDIDERNPLIVNERVIETKKSVIKFIDDDILSDVHHHETEVSPWKDDTRSVVSSSFSSSLAHNDILVKEPSERNLPPLNTDPSNRSNNNTIASTSNIPHTVNNDLSKETDSTNYLLVPTAPAKVVVANEGVIAPTSPRKKLIRRPKLIHLPSFSAPIEASEDTKALLSSEILPESNTTDISVVRSYRRKRSSVVTPYNYQPCYKAHRRMTFREKALVAFDSHYSDSINESTVLLKFKRDKVAKFDALGIEAFLKQLYLKKYERKGNDNQEFLNNTIQQYYSLGLYTRVLKLLTQLINSSSTNTTSADALILSRARLHLRYTNDYEAAMSDVCSLVEETNESIMLRAKIVVASGRLLEPSLLEKLDIDESNPSLLLERAMIYRQVMMMMTSDSNKTTTAKYLNFIIRDYASYFKAFPNSLYVLECLSDAIVALKSVQGLRAGLELLTELSENNSQAAYIHLGRVLLLLLDTNNNTTNSAAMEYLNTTNTDSDVARLYKACANLFINNIPVNLDDITSTTLAGVYILRSFNSTDPQSSLIDLHSAVAIDPTLVVAWKEIYKITKSRESLDRIYELNPTLALELTTDHLKHSILKLIRMYPTKSIYYLLLASLLLQRKDQKEEALRHLITYYCYCGSTNKVALVYELLRQYQEALDTSTSRAHAALMALKLGQSVEFSKSSVEESSDDQLNGCRALFLLGKYDDGLSIIKDQQRIRRSTRKVSTAIVLDKRQKLRDLLVARLKFGKYVNSRKNSHYTAAFTAYTNLIETYSEDAVLFITERADLVLKSSASSSINEAIAEYKTALEKTRDEGTTAVNLGCVYARINSLTRAISSFDNVITNPKNTSITRAIATYNRGRAYHLLNHTDRAISDYKGAIDLVCNSSSTEVAKSVRTRASSNLSQLTSPALFKKDEVDGITQCLKDIMKNPATSLQARVSISNSSDRVLCNAAKHSLLSYVITKNSGLLVEALVARGLLLRERDPKDFITALNVALENDSFITSFFCSGRNDQQTVLRKLEFKTAKNDFKNYGIISLVLKYKLAPSLDTLTRKIIAMIWYNIGYFINSTLGDRLSSLTFYSQALEFDPSNPVIKGAVGTILLLQHDFKNASEMLQVAPNFDLLLNCAASAAASSNTNRAHELLDIIISNAPRSSKIYAYALSNKAMLHLESSEEESALKVITAAIKAYPSCAELYLCRGQIYATIRSSAASKAAMTDFATAMYINPLIEL